MKINVDAAFVPNKGAAGAVAQDHRGNFLGCETTTFDATSSLLAESIAFNLGVSLAKNLALPRVIIEGDAKGVSTAILGDTQNIPWSIRSVVLKIRNESSSFTDIKFQHVPKSANYLAHALCQFAMHDDVIWISMGYHHRACDITSVT